ncbi:hypothetical protein PBY51_001024 [Eleginops maclovinus]|uniref:Uncharacterized protein n=1 Tax=Eleginops maclovinus TaxID=56733 RepID=A0AAN7XIM7_ELEMC|nr:hypothetical protein PBY51_001024 [Eleginops maclovinus]
MKEGGSLKSWHPGGRRKARTATACSGRKENRLKTLFFSMFKPKKATPAPAAAAETVKAKEEPKAAAKSSEAVVENKPAAVAPLAGEDAANVPKKLEKRNSIHLFFKNLGQRRSSTEAGVQTEQVPAAAAAEKAK